MQGLPLYVLRQIGDVCAGCYLGREVSHFGFLCCFSLFSRYGGADTIIVAVISQVVARAPFGKSVGHDVRALRCAGMCLTLCPHVPRPCGCRAFGCWPRAAGVVLAAGAGR